VRVLIHHDEPDAMVARLGELVPQAEVAACTTYDGLGAALLAHRAEASFHVRFENRPYPMDAVLACPTLRWLAVGGVGVDHLAPWDPARLTVTNGAGVNAEVMAWYVLGAMISLTMGFPRFLRQQARREWHWGQVGVVAGRTVCVVGLGHIGREVARLSSALGLTVVGTRAHPQPTPHVARVFATEHLHEALAEADYVAVCAPKTAATVGLVDAAAFAAMKRGARLVDVSRGGITVAADLIAALESGHLAGAALDVFDPEPMPADCPLWAMENVMVTPHSSGVFPGWDLKALELFAENLKRRLAGEPLVNIVDPARGY
jgi:phosphoglycerate dehydrogenase-like enzyme